MLVYFFFKFIYMFCFGFQVKLSVFPERRSAQYGGVPWWIIVLSVLLGLLLLALLAFLLWKVKVNCGSRRSNSY